MVSADDLGMGSVSLAWGCLRKCHSKTRTPQCTSGDTVTGVITVRQGMPSAPGDAHHDVGFWRAIIHQEPAVAAHAQQRLPGERPVVCACQTCGILHCT